MTNADDRIGAELVRTFRGEDPGEAFDERVMAEVGASGGGEHEVSVLLDEPGRRRWRWVLVPLAAAAVVAALVLRTGPGDRPADAERGSPSVELAGPEENIPGPGEIALPTAPSAEQARPPGILIQVTAGGEVSVDGEGVPIEKLGARLRAVAGGEKPVTIRADRRVAWRTVQWVMQACAGARLDRLSFAVRKAEGNGEAALTVPLPTDLDFTDVHDETLVRVTLARVDGEPEIAVSLSELEIGRGAAGFDRLREQAGVLRGKGRETGEVRAHGDIPFADVVRAVDVLRGAGMKQILFQGTTILPEEKTEERVTDSVVTLVVRRTGGETLFRIGDGPWEDPPLEVLVENLRNFRRWNPHARAVVDVGAGVPPEAVASAVDAFMEAGFQRLTISGALSPVRLPEPILRDRRAEREGLTTLRRVPVNLTLRRVEGQTRLEIAGKRYPLEKGLEVLRELLRDLEKRGESAGASISAEPEVAFGDVRRVMRLLDAEGIRDYVFVDPK